MKISEHLDKGVWTIADKSLLLFYGFAVIFLVINKLPTSEYGDFYVFQSMFLILSVLSDAIFLQPMVKFASEHEAEMGEVLAASFNLYTIFLILFGGALALLNAPIAALLNSKQLVTMLPFMPIFLVLGIFRNVGIRYLQVSYRIRAIFWVDLSFFGSIIVITVLANVFGLMHTATDFLKINMLGATISSMVAFIFCRDGYLRMPLFSVPRWEYGRLLSFAKYQAGTSTLLTLQQWSDALFVTMFWGPVEAGIFGAAKTIFRFLDAAREGATLLIVPVSSRLYTSQNMKGLSALIEKLLFMAFAALIPVSLVLVVIANPLFHIMYNGKYDAAAPIFQILMLSGFTMPLSLVATNVLIGIGKARSLFLAVLSATILFFVLNFLLVPSMHSMGAALTVLISTTALGLFTFFAMRSELEISARGILSRAMEAKGFVVNRIKGRTGDDTTGF
ncbi:MAG: polysaccharide biosynthesis C-terminal domain-containing protein [Candidatus Kapaibacterium sp.]|jgi:O-antigen/teichoic acid export membrane protein